MISDTLIRRLMVLNVAVALLVVLGTLPAVDAGSAWRFGLVGLAAAGLLLGGICYRRFGPSDVRTLLRFCLLAEAVSLVILLAGGG